jgi:glycerol-3-phosphate dehydrogenase subunit B
VAASPAAGLAGLPDGHCLALAGVPALQAALDEFQVLCTAEGYAFAGELRRNFKLPSAVGAVRPTCLAPQSYALGDLAREGELALARFPGFRDFFADFAVANLKEAGYAARAVTLDLPEMPKRREAFATDLARLFDRPAYREKIAQAWAGALKGARRLGMPAILGLQSPAEAYADLTAKLGLEIFEIPCLPPSVPGMRIYNVLLRALQGAGGQLVLGPQVSGWLEEGRVRGVISEPEGGPRAYAGKTLVLATGAFRHGGLVAPERGVVRETVLNLPVTRSEAWFAPAYWGAQPYARFGVRVNAQMQPLGERGEVIYPNVLAVGGLLAGADRTSEGSREGIDLATAWKAMRPA